ncbi:hypothetical protein EVAR_46005_1 [Eumeta japonica]|uniref:Uncharacterized protein n=1 Tax=Eumeta variegata TaxID=151549 RepID=A0A4C1XBF6_EUMVA|nr:hypothetical protein EVAR_46005_1 [Eumeta japonica]
MASPATTSNSEVEAAGGQSGGSQQYQMAAPSVRYVLEYKPIHGRLSRNRSGQGLGRELRLVSELIRDTLTST